MTAKEKMDKIRKIEDALIIVIEETKETSDRLFKEIMDHIQENGKAVIALCETAFNMMESIPDSKKTLRPEAARAMKLFEQLADVRERYAESLRAENTTNSKEEQSPPVSLHDYTIAETDKACANEKIGSSDQTSTSLPRKLLSHERKLVMDLYYVFNDQVFTTNMKEVHRLAIESGCVDGTDTQRSRSSKVSRLLKAMFDKRISDESVMVMATKLNRGQIGFSLCMKPGATAKPSKATPKRPAKPDMFHTSNPTFVKQVDRDD